MPDNAVQIVQYGSPYLDELNKLLLWFKEAGLDLQSRMRLNLKSSDQRASDAAFVKGLSFDNLSQVFQFYGLCLAICILTFLGELFWWQCSQAKR